MDVDSTLAQIRGAISRIDQRNALMDANGDEAGRLEELNNDDRGLVVECARDLDEWLSKGGFLPHAWQR